VMEGLTRRQCMVLALVVREYAGSAAPVGSQGLVRAYGLGISPATVRSEMALLEHVGYLRQPHTSAGRVPTVEGYRYFVQHLMGEVELPPVERRTIRHQFHQVSPGEMEQWLRLSASILARQAGVAALVSAPAPAGSHFRHVELLPLQGWRGMLVLVLEEGIVERQIFTLEQSLPSALLARTGDQLNQLLRSCSTDQVRVACSSLSGLAREVAERIAELMSAHDAKVGGQLFHAGLPAMLEQPEFAEGQAVRRLIHLLDRPRLLRQVLAEALTHSGVQVLIGGEGRWEALREYGMVLARYGVDGYAHGALGLLGPIRMPYERAICTVRYVAELMGELMRGA